MAMIKPGDKIKILKVTENTIPSSLGGKRTMALFMNGKLVGKEAKIDGFEQMDGFEMLDPVCFNLLEPIPNSR